MPYESKIIAGAEICLNEHNEVLWVEQYFMARIHKVKDTFIKDSKEYEVLRSSFTEGKLGGVLVEHVVRRIN